MRHKLCAVSLLCFVWLMMSLLESEAQDIESLIKKLEDKKVSVRWRAVVGLGNMDEPAVPALRAALSDESPDVRWRAVAGLSNMGESAVPALRAALSDESPDVRWRAVAGLKKIGTSEAIKAVEEYEQGQ